jgi:LEA14-like dessication related protein
LGVWVLIHGYLESFFLFVIAAFCVYFLWWDFKKSQSEIKWTRKKTKWIGVIALVISVLFVIDCLVNISTETAALQGVNVSISGVGTPSVDPSNASFLVTLSFQNPSSFNSPPFTMTYTVSVSGSTVATGSTSVGSVSPQGAQTSQLTVSISHSQVSSAIWSAISSDNFSITVSGTLEAKVLFGLIPTTESFTTSIHFG